MAKRKRWTPPPAWPPARKGWTPPTGWEPDPAWPPPPPDWEFWKSRRPLSRAAVLTVVVCVVAGGFFALMAVDMAEHVAGCGSVDLTDPNNYSEVAVVNDTPNPVFVGDCNGAYCEPSAAPARLDPGTHTTVRGACASAGKDMTSYRVTLGDGTEVGFIAIDTPRKHDGLTYLVTRASPDRVTATPPS